MTLKIKRVEHVAIAVDDMTKHKRLFEDLFGLSLELEEQIDTTKLAMYPVGGTYLELLETVEPESWLGGWLKDKGESLFHICFEVEDIDEALQELKGKGVKLLNDEPIIGHGGARIAFLDPGSTGNILYELAELPTGNAGHS
jgi:methylmalonyl-CoA/ethylmalonyl-CoA epimerase